jgi:hypothetical protein
MARALPPMVCISGRSGLKIALQSVEKASNMGGLSRVHYSDTNAGEMPLRLIERQPSLLLRIAFLILVAAIFGWGLQYKLSLYKASSHPDPIRIAKLIQGDQSNRRVVAIHLIRSQKLPQFSLECTIQAFRPPVPNRQNRPVDGPVLPSISFIPSFLFFRPPPMQVS